MLFGVRIISKFCLAFVGVEFLSLLCSCGPFFYETVPFFFGSDKTSYSGHPLRLRIETLVTKHS